MPLGPFGQFGPFGLILIVYIVMGVRVVFQLARNFRQAFDRNFTPADRQLVDQAAFFVLVPISVALHELGHAIAIWLFGGEVLEFGYFAFAGYVAFDPDVFTAVQRIIVASAGTIVNLLLAGLALGAVFLKRPPMRAAVNELLIQFTWISLLNALVLYPVLDLTSGLNGDWKQMYDGGVPALSAAILVIHISVLAALFWAWKSPAVQARVAALTGLPAGPRRGVASRGAGSGAQANETAAERALREAASRVASGWPTPVEGALQRGKAGSALVLSWGDGGLRRSVMAVAPLTGGMELSGALRADGGPPQQRPLGHDPGAIEADRLTMVLRLAMETVDGWAPPLDGAAPASPSPTPTPAR